MPPVSRTAPLPPSLRSGTLSPKEGEGSARTALANAATRFAFSATPRLDAELLLAHALGISRDALLLDLSRPAPASFAALVERRAAQEPVAYITGTRGFWTIDLHVGPGVLIPRADSETLIEAAVAHFAGGAAQGSGDAMHSWEAGGGTSGPSRVLDLGTGPGTLLLAALDQWPRAHGLGIDASERALDYAEMNAHALDLEERARFRSGDWADGLEGAFDLILANPPYVANDEPLPPEVSDYEPAGALFAGTDGLDAYRRLAPSLPRLLAPGGVACIEIGHTQATEVTALLTAERLSVTLHQDLGGRDRCLCATA